MATQAKKRLLIGLSGASGALLGIELLRLLREQNSYETHLIISRAAETSIRRETDYTAAAVTGLADQTYPIDAVDAAPASGSFQAEGMVVVPCSMKTVAGIACGYSDNLLLRAADVTLKEGRRLILVPRECPLSVIHLRNLLTAAEAGAMIMPPMPSYYHQFATLEAVNRQLIGRILEKFGIEIDGLRRWQG
ncbi:MAG: UbiX family flavin prenyltransferase [Sporomusaceae bacterium]|nr:UbiX family flavin prenyltransferase [Sporomusaceae bacterium]